MCAHVFTLFCLRLQGPAEVHAHAQVTVRCMIHASRMDVTSHVPFCGDGEKCSRKERVQDHDQHVSISYSAEMVKECSRSVRISIAMQTQDGARKSVNFADWDCARHNVTTIHRDTRLCATKHGGRKAF